MIKRLTIEIPEELKNEFKSLVSYEGSDMREKLIELIQLYIASRKS